MDARRRRFTAGLAVLIGSNTLSVSGCGGALPTPAPWNPAACAARTPGQPGSQVPRSAPAPTTRPSAPSDSVAGLVTSGGHAVGGVDVRFETAQGDVLAATATADAGSFVLHLASSRIRSGWLLVNSPAALDASDPKGRTFDSLVPAAVGARGGSSVSAALFPQVPPITAQDVRRGFLAGADLQRVEPVCGFAPRARTAELLNGAGQVVAGAVTSAAGRYRIPDVAPGRYRIRIRPSNGAAGPGRLTGWFRVQSGSPTIAPAADLSRPVAAAPSVEPPLGPPASASIRLALRVNGIPVAARVGSIELVGPGGSVDFGSSEDGDLTASGIRAGVYRVDDRNALPLLISPYTTPQPYWATASLRRVVIVHGQNRVRVDLTIHGG